MSVRLLIAALLLSAIPAAATAAVVEGVVLTENGPLRGATVRAYDRLDDVGGANTRAVSAAGGKPGFYRLELPPGEYYLVAEGKNDQGSFFAFHGANPVRIGEEGIWLPFTATPKTALSAREAEAPAVAGRVTFKGAPVSGARVSLYPLRDGTFRGMGLATRTTGADGRFLFTPESGEYLVVARKRMDGRAGMPLKTGDLFCYAPGNPVVVSENAEVSFELPCYPRDDLQGFLEPGAVVRRTNAQLVRFREKRNEPAALSLSIAGRVTDLDGKPVAGLTVSAYRADPGQPFQMHFVRLMAEAMAVTDPRGEYVLKLREKGSYYLVARELAGGAPRKGERYGLYAGNVDHMVLLDGQVAGADMAVGRVMAEDRGPADAGTAGAVRHRFAETVLERDTVWEGDILVEGRVVVKQGATLTIRPGTTVRFARIDRNGDGIGDGELRVLGRLVARGTPGRIIRFTSAEQNPRSADWSYLLIFASGEESVVEHCRFEHAFTGLQVHFGRAVVRDSIFTGNVEGIRFGRAEMRIEHNEITGNTIGIRHHRLEGPVVITANVIRDNDVGIFLVPSGQNSVDFSSARYSVEPTLQMLPIVTGNDLSGNRSYSYKLGERQAYDVVLRDNWWGRTDEAAIRELIFDRRSDPALGEVVNLTRLSAPPKEAGVRKGE
ncbi:right-handed parallel beta-helix repeat-containing protein [Geobacter sp.]|uniref:right-handed parallel beta-helix repeat-containing protein n=1 Tax=Geobacter sp. TaxID=46610 RepID=UPI002638A2A8|nr:right-handed parallel beta-helix repeat-containing protein [Geobacter sp.]